MQFVCVNLVLRASLFPLGTIEVAEVFVVRVNIIIVPSSVNAVKCYSVTAVRAFYQTAKNIVVFLSVGIRRVLSTSDQALHELPFFRIYNQLVHTLNNKRSCVLARFSFFRFERYFRTSLPAYCALINEISENFSDRAVMPSVNTFFRLIKTFVPSKSFLQCCSRSRNFFGSLYTANLLNLRSIQSYSINTAYNGSVAFVNDKM